MTNWALLYVAPGNMKFPFNHPAIITRLPFGTPVVFLGTIRNPRNRVSVQYEGGNVLGSRNLLRPTFNHRYTAIYNALLLGHISFLSITDITVNYPATPDYY